MQQKLVIIAAGGTGSRLNANLPKQYMLLNKRPILMHTIEAFASIADHLIIAIHPHMITYWADLCQQYNFNIPHEIAVGGTTRFQSVKAALLHLKKSIPEQILKNANIAIHDAARPLVDQTLILASFNLASQGISNALAQKSTNSIRIGTNQHSESVDRDTVWQIQTPQTFPAKILYEAYQQDENSLFTDDCSVVEKLGYPIHLIESSPKNLKITFPEDFEIAQFYLEKLKES